MLAVAAKSRRYAAWFVRQVAKQFREDGCTTSASALTFTTLVATVPFVAIVYRVLSLFPDFSGIGDTITGFVFDTFVPGSSEVVLEKVREFSAKANQLTLVGIGVLVVSTMLMIKQLEEALNRIWRVTDTRTRLARFLSYWGTISFGVPMIGVAVTVAGYDFGADFMIDFRESPLMDFVRDAIPPIATTVTFTFLYYVVPSCHVRFIHALFGGLAISILFLVAKEIFTWLVPTFPSQVIYGALAALPLFVLGLYLLWVFVLLGAISVRTLATSQWEEVSNPIPQAVKCARVLFLLQQAHLKGTAISDSDIVHSVPMNRTEQSQIYDFLRDGKWLRPTRHKTWELGRSLESVTLWELFVRFPRGLTQDNLGDDGAVEDRFRKFLKEGAIHLNVNLSELTPTTSDDQANPKDEDPHLS